MNTEGMEMELSELEQWGESFAEFCGRFGDLFERAESRQQMCKYLRGLLMPLEVKTSWQLAEMNQDTTPDRMQRLLYRVPWNADAARDRLQEYVIEQFADADGIGVVDETGILKKGTASVGVQRQYSGTAGRIENCQMATVLTYATQRDHVFLDRRLYLPEEWSQDRARRRQAQVPETVRFQTKPEQAIEMLEEAWERGVPMRWVTGDEVYGDATYLRERVERAGKWYVLAVSSITPVWTERPEVEEPAPQTGGRPRTKRRLAASAPPAQTVAQVAAAVPKKRWKRRSIGVGTKGPRVYDWARVPVIESRHGLPGPQVSLLVRRSIRTPSELAYYLALAPSRTPVQQLIHVAGTRYTVEQCIEEAKGEAGLDQYQVRYWHSWYRHITLVMLAHAWLAAQRRQPEEKKGDDQADGPRSASLVGDRPTPAQPLSV